MPHSKLSKMLMLLVSLSLLWLAGCGDSAQSELTDSAVKTLPVDATFVRDYGNFALYEDASGRLFEQDTQGMWLRDASQMKQIHLRRATETAQTQSKTNLLSQVDGAAGIRLLHHRGAITDGFVKRLQQHGLVVLDYIPENAYVVYDSGKNLAAALADTKNDIDYARNWKQADRLHPRLDNQWGELDVAVYVVQHPGNADTVEIIKSKALEFIASAVTIRNHKIYKVRLDSATVGLLTTRSDVYWVEPYIKPKMMDERQDMIMAGELNSAGTQPSNPGYLSWLQARGLQTGLNNVIVDITDSGCDVGSTTGMHPDLQGHVVYINNYTSDSSGHDIDGHGTLNLSIVGAYPNPSGSGVLDPAGYLYGLGVAPGVGLAASRVFDADGWDTGSMTLTQIVTASYDGGARISTNSWGKSNMGEYDSEAQEYDALVRDSDRNADNGLQPMTILFSAGNDGDGGQWGSGETFESIGAPGTAKNVITVGASENWRPTGDDGCGQTSAGADNAKDLADFSSRGFCLDGRLKPDIVAPGTHIQGVASSDPNYQDVQGTCDEYWPSGQTLYTWSSGTSHSTPAAAGTAALVAHWYNQTYDVEPSPAMIKAIMSNHTYDLVGGNTGYGGAIPNIPNKWVGWGGIDMSGIFTDAPRIVADQTELFTQTGQSFEMQNLRPADSGQPVKITLAFTDAPGATSGNNYNNDLNLLVTLDNGTQYKGNVFSEGYSATGGDFDAKNNIEVVFLPVGGYSSFTVEVIAANINSDGLPGNGDSTDQDFALYVSNAQDRIECQNNSDCDDDNPCTLEFCDNDGMCTTSPKCDDDNICTQNVCDEQTGACSYPSISCSDNNPCTVDLCEPNGGCYYEDETNCTACGEGGSCFEGQCISCDDHNDCTTDSCNVSGGCQNEALDDCSACGESGSCIGGECNYGSDLLIEGFESGLPSGDGWETSGNADWQQSTAQMYSGLASAASGDIDDSEVSTLSLTVTLSVDGEVSFYHMEDTESSYDYLQFLVDGELVDEWAGSNNWEQFTHPLSAGEHELQWTYDKDGSQSDGADKVWIDDVSVSGVYSECDDGNACTIESKVGNVCVSCGLTDGTDCSDGNECSQNATCQSGSCIGDPYPDQTPCTPDDSPCTGDYCISGQCAHPALPDNSACEDDGNSCTQDYCISGSCEHPAVGNGLPCTGNGDGNECTTDSCQNGACISEALDDCSSCADGQNVCVGGYCGGQGGLLSEGFEANTLPTGWTTGGDANWLVTSAQAYAGSRSAVNGDIGDNQISWLELTVNLIEAGTVSFYHRESTESSFDYLKFLVDGQQMQQWAGTNNWSQYSRALAAGSHVLRWVYDKDVSQSSGEDSVWIDQVVVTGAGQDCDDSEACTIDGYDGSACVHCALPEGADCSDGLFCNGVESCRSSVCTAENVPVIEDDNPCTDDWCDEDTDTVMHRCDDSNSCDDGIFCNGVATCNNCACVAAEPVDCDDDNPCTDDSCDNQADACQYVNNTAACDDGLWCTVNDQCAGGECGSTPRDCEDNFTCTAGQCNEDQDQCEQLPAHDGWACYYDHAAGIVGECLNGVCALLCHSNADCDDEISCTRDVCNEQTGTCSNTPVDLACDDNNPCTDDTCDAALDCQSVANDNNACDDGLFCMTGDHCSNGVCVSQAMDCDDGFTCTVGECNEDLDQCEQLPSHDGWACYVQFNPPVLGECLNGSCIWRCNENADCDDSIGCTIDTCDSASGECVHTPDDDACDDGIDWTEDSCDPQLDCQHIEASGNCDNPIVIQVSSETHATLAQHPSHLGAYASSCGISADASGSDVIFQLDLLEGDSVDIVLAPNDFDAGLLILSECVDGATCLDAADSNADSGEERLTFVATADGPVLIVVENFGDLATPITGDFVLTVTYTPVVDGDVIDGDIVDGDLPVDGDFVDGDTPVDGDVVDGDTPVDGDVVDGDVVDGDTPVDGDVVDGDTPVDGDVVDGDVVDGDMPVDGDVVDGDTPVDGDVVDGDTPVDGDVVDGDLVDGDLVVDGDLIDGDLIVDGDTLPDGDDLPETCTPSETICDGNVVMTCNAEGDGWIWTKDCDDQVCIGGTCQDAPDGDVLPGDVDADDDQGSGGSGGGCQQQPLQAAWLWLALLLAGCLMRRRKSVIR